MEVFSRTCASPETAFYADTLYSGWEVVPGDPASVVSLNGVDALWDVNLLHRPGSREYFGHEPSAFLYHFREALWYDLLRELAGFDRGDMRGLILNNLHLEDPVLTNGIAERTLC